MSGTCRKFTLLLDTTTRCLKKILQFRCGKSGANNYSLLFTFLSLITQACSDISNWHPMAAKR